MSNIFEKVRKAVKTELDSIQNFYETLDPNFEKAVQLIFDSKGKVIVTGVGKSGDIAKKISSTMSSTGTPAIFLHPTDSAHGDAGLISKEDIVIAIGKSGESEELISLIPTIKSIGAKLISITANEKSKLAKESDITILTPILQEACPLALAPTSSTTIALIAGDAIAMALMEMKDFKAEDFAIFHPSGRLGKRLSLLVADIMRKDEDLAFVNPDALFQEILIEISNKRLGAVAVVDSQNMLLGFITDYDIRKKLTGNFNLQNLKALDIMNTSPIFFKPEQKAYDVLIAMEERKHPISVAPILNEKKTLLGIISIHDLMQKGL